MVCNADFPIAVKRSVIHPCNEAKADAHEVFFFPRLCTASLMTAYVGRAKTLLYFWYTWLDLFAVGSYARGITMDVTRDVRKLQSDWFT